jgi:hypothetical protein
MPPASLTKQPREIIKIAVCKYFCERADEGGLAISFENQCSGDDRALLVATKAKL